MAFGGRSTALKATPYEKVIGEDWPTLRRKIGTRGGESPRSGARCGGAGRIARSKSERLRFTGGEHLDSVGKI
jgi:hypothetical protein